ncbi:MAG: sodium/solute symporter [Zetaproteobacteria bacterium]|nr:sodium/solute symporter [Zetaproteobacteria bacterium]
MVFSFVAYLLAMLIIGWLASRQSHAQKDYFLGGRSIGPFAAAMSACASDMSGWLLMGIPGYVYAKGFSVLWIMCSLLLGSTVCWLVLAKPLRNLSVACNNAITIPQFIHERFHCRSPALRQVASIFILIFFVIYASSGVVASAKLMHNSFHLPYLVALGLSGFAICSYTFLGGFLAVVWTDVIQACIILCALIAVPLRLVMLAADQGWTASVASLYSSHPHLFSLYRTDVGIEMGWLTVLSLCGWGLGYFGQPHIITRYFALKSANQVQRSAAISFVWNSLSLFFALSIGILGLWYCHERGVVLQDPETVFIFLAETLYDPIIAGALLSAILAAVMSTADSQLLIASTCFTHDLFHVAAERRAVVGKLALVVMTAIACLLGTDPESSVLSLVSLAWAGFGAGFGPVLLASRYFALKSANQVQRSAAISFVWNSLSLFFALSIGILGLWYCHERGVVLQDPETVFIFLAETLYDPIIAGALLSAILAAVMSTADSQLLIASTCFTHDLFHVAAERRAVVGKLALVVMTAIACLLGTDPESSVLSLVSLAWAGFGAGFGPVLLASCYSHKLSERTAWVGILLGCGAVLWCTALRSLGYSLPVYELLPAFSLSLLGVCLSAYYDQYDSGIPHLNSKG